ncbi:MAG: YhbY family RNA-binding protein [Oscillospiraceae bacterium]|nr:YhbY family RNA-binding protein [Oscillospiraceae bacterium]
MITSKQRAKLRASANSLDTIFQVGKGGIGDELVQQVKDALKARELIKLRVLETAPDHSRKTAQDLAEKTGADIVQVIGSRFVLYKRNPQKPIYELD